MDCSRLGERVEAARLAGLLGGPKRDGQGDGLAQHGVMEDAEYHGQCARTAQRHGLGVLAAVLRVLLWKPRT